MLALATPSRPVYLTCRNFTVPTRTERHAIRLGELQTTAERIGLRWGGIEAGKVTLLVGDGKVTMRLSAIENCLQGWAARFDQGDLRWYDWLFATTNYEQAQWSVVYLQRLIARGAELTQGDINSLNWLKRTGQWPA